MPYRLRISEILAVDKRSVNSVRTPCGTTTIFSEGTCRIRMISRRENSVVVTMRSARLTENRVANVRGKAICGGSQSGCDSQETSASNRTVLQGAKAGRVEYDRRTSIGRR